MLHVPAGVWKHRRERRVRLVLTGHHDDVHANGTDVFRAGREQRQSDAGRVARRVGDAGAGEGDHAHGLGAGVDVLRVSERTHPRDV